MSTVAKIQGGLAKSYNVYTVPGGQFGGGSFAIGRKVRNSKASGPLVYRPPRTKRVQEGAGFLKGLKAGLRSGGKVFRQTGKILTEGAKTAELLGVPGADEAALAGRRLKVLGKAGKKAGKK